MASRSLDDLHPEFRARVDLWLLDCKLHGLDVLVYCTYRSDEEQAAEYAKGRTKPGAKTTNAKPGQSAHNHRLALDFVPLVNGKPQWSTRRLYNEAIDIAERAGLEALRNFGFPELAHLQMPGWRGYVPTN